MAKNTLVIVESPAKAKTIEKYLGPGFKVRSSIGHVRDLPKSNKDAVDIEGGFIPRYIISPGKEKVISDLQKEAKAADVTAGAEKPMLAEASENAAELEVGADARAMSDAELAQANLAEASEAQKLSSPAAAEDRV